VGEEVDGVGDVEAAVVVAVARIIAGTGLTAEENLELEDGIADIDAAITVSIAALEDGLFAVVEDAVAIPIATAGEITDIGHPVAIAIVIKAEGDITGVQDAIAVAIGIGGILTTVGHPIAAVRFFLYVGSPPDDVGVVDLDGFGDGFNDGCRPRMRAISLLLT
jgi:hypothetical protein